MFPCTINAEASALLQFSAPLGIFRNSRSVPVHPAKLQLPGGSVTAANWYKIDGMQEDGGIPHPWDPHGASRRSWRLKPAKRTTLHDLLVCRVVVMDKENDIDTVDSTCA